MMQCLAHSTTNSENPHVCSPLSVVPNSSSKLCLALNLWYFNQLMHVVSFRYKDLRMSGSPNV